jgi:hypothetical protein
MRDQYLIGPRSLKSLAYSDYARFRHSVLTRHFPMPAGTIRFRFFIR